MVESFGKLTAPYTIKHIHTLHSAISLLSIYPREIKNLCPHKDLQIDVHNSFFHNSPKLETILISINGWLYKLWYIHTIEYYSAIQINYWYVWLRGWIPKVLCQVKETGHKRTHTVWLYDSKYMEFKNRQNHSLFGDRCPDSGCLWVLEVNWKRAWRNFLRQWNYPISQLHCWAHGVYVCQNSSNYTVTICVFHHMQVIQ